MLSREEIENWDSSLNTAARHAHSFTREEHQALHALTLADLVRDSWCFRTIADIPVRIEVVDKLKALGLAKFDPRLRIKGGHVVALAAEITPRGKIVAEQLGAPGLFPLRALVGR